jgi:hypothetical protein
VGRSHLEREIEAQKRRGHLVSGWDSEVLTAIVRNAEEFEMTRPRCARGKEQNVHPVSGPHKSILIAPDSVCEDDRAVLLLPIRQNHPD